MAGHARQAASAAAEDTVAVNVALPTPVHRKLRVKAIQENMTMAQAVTAAVVEWTRGTRG